MSPEFSLGSSFGADSHSASLLKYTSSAGLNPTLRGKWGRVPWRGVFGVASTPGDWAALTSAATFAIGASLPLALVFVAPVSALVPAVSVASIAFLALFGAVGARAGGANMMTAVVRVTFWGLIAMAITAGIGRLIGEVE